MTRNDTPRRTAPNGRGRTVEDLIKYAALRFENAGLVFEPSRVSRLIRKAGPARAQEAVDAYIASKLSERNAEAPG